MKLEMGRSLGRWKRIHGFHHLLLLLFQFPVLMCLAGPLDTWQVRRQLSGPAAVRYGNDRFVVIPAGYLATGLMSTNGIDWKGYLLPESGYFQSLSYANGNFLLVLTRQWNPDSGVVLYSSTNGISWVLRNLQSLTQYGGIPISEAGGGYGFYVFAGANLVVSTNLQDWTLVERGPTGAAQFVAGNGLVVGRFWIGSAFIASSEGLIWEYVLPPGGFAPSSLCFGAGQFAAFATASSDGLTPATIGVTADIENWRTSTVPDFSNATAVVSANNKFFLLNTVTNGFSCSDDGIAWETHSFGTNMTCSDVAFGANTYVAVGDFVLQSGPVTNVPSPSVLSICTYPGITITGALGRHYRLEYSDEPTGTNGFRQLSDFLLPKSPFLWVDTTATNSARFYRAVEQP